MLIACKYISMHSPMKVYDIFNINLFSNVRHTTFQNTTSHFRTELSRPLEFKGYWEVGLLSIDFPKTWYNTPKHPEQERTFSLTREEFQLIDRDVTDLDRLDQLKSVGDTGTYRDKLSIKSMVSVIDFGKYTIQELVDGINEKLRRFDNRYDNYYKRHTTLAINKHNLICTLFVGIGDNIILPGFLARLLKLDKCEDVKIHRYGETELYDYYGPPLEDDIELYNEVLELHHAGGLAPDDTYRYGNVFVGGGVPSFPLDTTSLIIYSNIVDYEMVGNMETRLLRTVRTTGPFGEIINRTYDTPIFKKLSWDKFQEIDIVIRSDDGEYVPFEYGNVSIVIQLRGVVK